MLPRARFAWLSLGTLACTGCMVPKTPGELVGSYHISADLSENECGSSALPAPDRLSFDVELRKDKNYGYWLRGMPPATSGVLDDDGAFDFHIQSTYDVGVMMAKDPIEALITMDPAKLADPQTTEQLDQLPKASCRLTVDERVHGTLQRSLQATLGKDTGDAGTATSSHDLLGDNDITIRSGAGTDCSAALSSQGGPFDQLPCKAHYALTGTLGAK